MNSTTANSAQERLWELIRDIRFAMFTTRQDDGRLQSHPMTVQNRGLDDDLLWFFMSRSGEPIARLRNDAQVHLAFADPAHDRYVSVSGTAGEVDDRERIRAMWSSPAQAWFPNGPEDPDVALVAVRIEQAHYWNVQDNKPVQLYRMAKAVITGRTPDLRAESREVKMR